MNEQKVSIVDSREVKFFDTRKEAREYNRKNGTVGVQDAWDTKYCYSNQLFHKRWFVFLDVASVNGKPAVFFETREDACNFNRYQDKSGVRYLWTKVYEGSIVVGNTNNYPWFVFI